MPGIISRIRYAKVKGREVDIIRIYGVPRRRSRENGPLRGQSPSPKQALGEGSYQERMDTFLRGGNGEGGLHVLFRRHIGIPAFLPSSGSARFLPVPIRRKILSMRGSSLRWGPSPMWFREILRNFVRYIRDKWQYHVLPYIDDSLIAPSRPGQLADKQDVTVGRTTITRSMSQLGLDRKLRKGCWEGSRQIDHLGFHIGNETLRVYDADHKVQRIRSMARQLITRASRNSCFFSADAIRHFYDVCVSLYLAVPLSRFFTHSLYSDHSSAKRAE